MKSLTINPIFTKLWTANSLSSVGDGIARSALPLLAAMLTRDPALVAGFSFALTLPWLLFSLHAGVLIDRLDRRRVLLFVVSFRMLLLAGLALVIYVGAIQLLWLYVIAFLYGSTEMIFDNVSTAILPAVVERSELEPANSRLFAASFIGSGLLGPSLGGFLFAAFAGLPFLVHGGLLAFAIALLAALRGNFRPREPKPFPTGLHREIGEGFVWLRENRLLLNLAITAGMLNVAAQAGGSVLVLYALEVLRLSDAGYGFLLSVATVGGIFGSLVSTSFSRRLGSGQAILLSVFLMGCSYPLMVAGSLAWITAIGLILRSFSMLLWNVNVVSLRQSIVPDRLLGRVNSVYRLVGMGATPLGALLGGVLASHFGLRAPFWVGGAAVFITLLVILPLINNRTVAQAKQSLPAD